MTTGALAFFLARPFLHRMDAETAHGLTLRALARLPAGRPPTCDPRLAVNILGLAFPNPLGLAAGFDKNVEVPDVMLGLGFGFVEVGTVTPQPQQGNPRPRLFRLPEDEAVINRMGFNNAGHAVARARLVARRARPGIVGVNIGANRDSADRISDYVKGIEAFSDLASYLTVNISSPNTPGLRALQSRHELEALLERLDVARSRQDRKPPMLLKIAPDLRDDELEDIAAACRGGAVDGIIISNTTVRRDGVRSRLKAEQGGLSGRPLFGLSTLVLARIFLLTDGRIPLVGVGGIHDAQTAWVKLCAGASLLQVYSALVYRGPALVTEVIEGIRERLIRERCTLGEIRGRDAATIAHHGLSGT